MNYIILMTLKYRVSNALLLIYKMLRLHGKNKSIEKLLLLISLFFSKNTFAHVRWFVTEPGEFYNSHFTWDNYSCLITFGAVLFLAICSLTEVRRKYHPTLEKLLYAPIFSGDLIFPSLKLACGIYLLSNLIQGHFIAPHFSSQEQTQTEMLVQAILLIVLIVNQNLFSYLFFALAICLIFFYPIRCVIDYVPELAAIGAALWFSSKNNNLRHFRISFNDKLLAICGQDLALITLRFGLGLQLVVLTIHDKLIYPGFALNFLHEYPYFNFIRVLGFQQFTDMHFVLGAGCAELCFGLLLITNIASRIGVALILFFFTLSGIILGPTELMGHVPILLIALLLFLTPSPKIIFLNSPRTALNT